MICTCGHWLEDHPGRGSCQAIVTHDIGGMPTAIIEGKRPICACEEFDYDGGVV